MTDRIGGYTMEKKQPNGFLDFNRDGKVDAAEEYLGFMMMQDVLGTDDPDGDAIDKNFPDEDEYPQN